MWLHAAESTYDCEKELESLDMNINLKNKMLAQCGLHFNLLCVTYEIEMGVISTHAVTTCRYSGVCNIPSR